MTTTHCLGSCPAYSATFWSDGRVKYRGEAFVERLGDATGHLDLFEYAALCEFVGRTRFADLRNTYRAQHTDAATVTIAVTFTTTGETKTVLDDGDSAPAEFWALHGVLEGLLTRVRWAQPQTR